MLEQPILDRLQDAHTVRVYTPISRNAVPFKYIFLDIILPMLLLGTCTFTTVTGAAFALITQSREAAVAAGAFALGSLTAAIIGVVQLHRYHEKQFVIKEYDLDPPIEAEPRVIPTNGNGGERLVTFPRSGKNLEYGNLKFHFTGRNLDELKRRYLSGDKFVRRDAAGELLGFSSLPDAITGNKYTSAREVLRGLSYVDDKNEWTEAGISWLNED